MDYKILLSCYQRIYVFLFICLILQQRSHCQVDSTVYDPLLLNEVVISDQSFEDKLQAPISVYSLDGEDLMAFQGTAAGLNSIPGQFIDASPGEVFSRVHTRGISLSAEDDIGWYYTALLEDGLPISAVQYNQYSPDFFFRPDLSIDNLEAVRGGKSVILSSNSPGGIMNFTSRLINHTYNSHDKFTFGLYDNQNIYARIEGRSGGPIGSKNWFHETSYMYRYDQSPKDLDYSMNEGGQFKIALAKVFPKSLFSLSMKYLNDKVNRLTGVAAVIWDAPRAAFDQSFSSTSLLPPSFDALLPDGRNVQNANLPYNPAAGIRSKELAFKVDYDVSLGEWTLESKTKYSRKSLDWQTAIGGQPLRLENFLTYFISGDPFPVGQVEFVDVIDQTVLASVNNTGILSAFQGLPPSFEYTQGRLPFDAIMGTGTWKKDDSINEFMQDIQVSLKNKHSSLLLGGYTAYSSVNVFTTASFLYSTYEARSRLLQVTLNNPGEPVRSLSDPNGVSNYGALLYQGASLDVWQNSIYGQLLSTLSDNDLLDLGFRVERIHHGGTKDFFDPYDEMGGIDQNPLTSYDNATLTRSGTESIDYSYLYLSYSLGINHTIGDRTSIYARYSNGNKAPELNYYLNNFSNVPVLEKGFVQDIEQLEAGLKWIGHKSSMTVSTFYSKLDNVPFSEFVFDTDINQIFYSPTLFNSSETIGLEVESRMGFTENLYLTFDLTLQSASLKNYQLYQTEGSISLEDDSIIDYSGNEVPHSPSIMHRATLQYKKGRMSGMLTWNFMGSRFGNVSNSFTMDAYSTFNMSLSMDLSSHLYWTINVENMLNNQGIINFFGPNEFGSNANQATADYIGNNPEASFVVFTILPRALYFSFGYRFEKRDTN